MCVEYNGFVVLFDYGEMDGTPGWCAEDDETLQVELLDEREDATGTMGMPRSHHTPLWSPRARHINWRCRQNVSL